MELVRDLSCFRGLNWRCDLPPGSDCEVLALRLGPAGWTSAPSVAKLLLLRSAEGHEILLVPRTLRVQIRVHYLTPEAERRLTAERAFVALVRGVLALAPTRG